MLMLDVPEVDVENTNEAAAEIPNVEVDTPPAATETPAVVEVKEKLEPGGVIINIKFHEQDNFRFSCLYVDADAEVSSSEVTEVLEDEDKAALDTKPDGI